MNRYLIWGSGGHGKVVADLIRATGGEVVGFVDRDAERLGLQVEPGGGRVVMTEDVIQGSRDAADVIVDTADSVAVAIGANSRRLECVRLLGPACAGALRHPSAIISPSVETGQGSVVFPGVVINAAAVIGDAVIANSACVIEHDCRIGDGVHISPGAVLAGGVTVGPRTWIGAGATIIQGITIGADATVGAGAVVIRDVPDGATVVGVPAAPVRRGRIS
jgi:sugar O-acyltransferase (sialic acid O-acetyltransferase NeuD family)